MAEINVDDGPTFLPTAMLLNLDHPDHDRLKGFVGSAYSAAAITRFRHLSREIQLAHYTDAPQLLKDFWTLYTYLGDLSPDAGRGSPVCQRPARRPRHGVTDSQFAVILLGSLIVGDQNILSVVTKIVYVALARSALWNAPGREPGRDPGRRRGTGVRLLPLGPDLNCPRRVRATEIALEHRILYPG